MAYIYRFLNQYGIVIYIGRTNNLIRRLRHEHFSKNGGHLPQSCYNETARVEYACVNSQNEAKIYELYYIEKYHPKYNQADIGGGSFSFELDELTWQVFGFSNDKQTKTKQEILDSLTNIHQTLRAECRIAEDILRHKDRVLWLDKLTQEERNEYLRVIYSLERFVHSMQDISQQIEENMQPDVPRKTLILTE